MGDHSYIILTREDKEQFVSLVNEYIEIGWTPLGGPFTTPFCPGYGNVHAFAPDAQSGLAQNLTIGIEYNQAMIIDSKERR